MLRLFLRTFFAPALVERRFPLLGKGRSPDCVPDPFETAPCKFLYTPFGNFCLINPNKIKSVSASILDTEYDRAKVPPYNGNDPCPSPGSLKALLFPPLLMNKVLNKGTQGVQVIYDTELPPFPLSGTPGRPVILGIEIPWNYKSQEWPWQTKPKKGQFMNFSRGHSRTKVQCESCLFSQGRTPEFTKMGGIHELFVLVWCAGATPENR